MQTQGYGPGSKPQSGVGKPGNPAGLINLCRTKTKKEPRQRIERPRGPRFKSGPRYSHYFFSFLSKRKRNFSLIIGNGTLRVFQKFIGSHRGILGRWGWFVYCLVHRPFIFLYSFFHFSAAVFVSYFCSRVSASWSFCCLRFISNPICWVYFLMSFFR